MFNYFNNLPEREKRMTWSTGLTLVRMALVPVIVVAIFKAYWGSALVLFLLAGVTDMLDGYLARRFNQQTLLGAALDPIADKLLVLSCFFTLATVQSPLGTIPFWFVVLIACKELLIVVGALMIYRYKGSIVIKPTMFGKTAGVLQMGCVIGIVACYFFNWMSIAVYYSVLSIVAFLALGALVQYSMIALKQFKTK
ncbi:MAG: CDP-alcohol phosphatidyltransferase family protein [Candidatus Dependentiae bacterium]|nr:CDP-alcohol phosphatidyltransferase family protein [Candidatus Dependentiae bacterium]